MTFPIHDENDNRKSSKIEEKTETKTKADLVNTLACNFYFWIRIGEENTTSKYF